MAKERNKSLPPAASCNPASQAEAGSTRPKVVNDPTTNSTPNASTDPSSEDEARANAFGVLAETTLVHSGFRTEVSGTPVWNETVSQALSAAGGKQAVTVSLRNLSPSTVSIQSRATINFASEFDNFGVLPTVEGPLTLYLNRDGTLGPSPDTGGFT